MIPPPVHFSNFANIATKISIRAVGNTIKHRSRHIGGLLVSLAVFAIIAMQTSHRALGMRGYVEIKTYEVSIILIIEVAHMNVH